MDTALEVRPEEVKLQAEGPRIIREAELFKVTDDKTMNEAVDRGNTIKSKLDAAIAFFKPMKDAAFAAHKAVCNREKLVTECYETAKKLYIQKAANYQAKIEAEIAEKERKAKEEAERKEREERVRLAEEARKKEAEETKKREEARKADEAAKKAAREGDEKKAAEARAKADKARADADAAEKAAENARERQENVYIAPRPVAQASKPTGMSVQKVWKVEVIDEKLVPIKWWNSVDVGRLKRAKTADPSLEVKGIRFIQVAQGAALGAR